MKDNLDDSDALGSDKEQLDDTKMNTSEGGGQEIDSKDDSEDDSTKRYWEVKGVGKVRAVMCRDMFGAVSHRMMFVDSAEEEESSHA